MAAPIKIALEKTLQSEGFKRSGKIWIYHSADVHILVGFQRTQPTRQLAVNVGFWLTSLGSEVPTKIELTHLYYRLERLCPHLREAIVAGGDIIEGDATAENLFDRRTAMTCTDRLKSLASMTALKAAFQRGELSEGLIRKEARTLLST